MIFEIKKSGFGKQKYRIVQKGDNGEVVASGEKLNNKQDAIDTVEMIKREAATAKVKDLT